jgi:hypothetical protein
VGLPQRSRLSQPDARRQRRDESAVKVLRAILRELRFLHCVKLVMQREL